MQKFTKYGIIKNASICKVGLIIFKPKNRRRKNGKRTPIYYSKDFSSIVEMLDALKIKVAEMKNHLENIWNIEAVETQITAEEAYAIIYLSEK